MLTKEDYFFLIFIGVILFVRLFLYLKPTPGPTVSGFRIHHWMVGLLLLGVASLFIPLSSTISWRVPLAIFAVGLALFVDELTYLLLGGQTHADNYSKVSLVGTSLFVGIIFFVRKHIVLLFGK